MTENQYRKLIALDIESIELKLKKNISDILGQEWKLEFNTISPMEANVAIIYIESAIRNFKETNYIGKFNYEVGD